MKDRLTRTCVMGTGYTIVLIRTREVIMSIMVNGETTYVKATANVSTTTETYTWATGKQAKDMAQVNISTGKVTSILEIGEVI